MQSLSQYHAPYVGSDYFCDTASKSRYQHVFYPNDPLWDGQGCGYETSELQQASSGGPIVVAKVEPLQRLELFTHNVLVTVDVSQDCLLGVDVLT